MQISSEQWRVANLPSSTDAKSDSSESLSTDQQPQWATAPGAGLMGLAPPEHLAGRASLQTVAGERSAAIATPNSLSATQSSERLLALDATAVDFHAAMELARQDSSQSGPGWVQVRVPSMSAAVNPWAKPEEMYQAQPLRQFNEAAFRDAYMANGGKALQELAKAYGLSSAAELLAVHPELRWTVLDISGAAHDPSRPPLNGEGPQPAWVPPYSSQTLLAAAPADRDRMQRANESSLAQHQAMLADLPSASVPTADSASLQAIDTMLAQPAHQWLLAEFGGTVRGVAELDPTKVTSFGLQRAQVMDLLERARAALGIPPPPPPFKGEASVSAEILSRRDTLVAQAGTEFKAYLQSQGIDDAEKWEWGFSGQAARLHQFESNFAQTNQSVQSRPCKIHLLPAMAIE